MSNTFALVPFLCLFTAATNAQLTVPAYYRQEKKFNESLKSIVSEAGLDSTFNVGEDGVEHISLAVIDLTDEKALFGGVHYDNFIYPASVYKMYVAMEILRQVNSGKYAMFAPYVVTAPNVVDRTREIAYDPRPLLSEGDTVTIHYLLDLMITRSDNSAANCLIDQAGRSNINATMRENKWEGSEVTRKFLNRKLEDPGFATIKSTETCALHAADFMFKIYSGQLINPWVSAQMKSLLAMQLDTTKLSTGLPRGSMFYHKTGWWSFYTHDTGIVEDGNIRYVISLFTPVPEERARPLMKQVSEKVYELVSSRHPHRSR
jgi:beta-lactamase class A